MVNKAKAGKSTPHNWLRPISLRDRGRIGSRDSLSCRYDRVKGRFSRWKTGSNYLGANSIKKL
jgi:hypothetical protein